jgi:tetratricopeptide (TPR) repeat protein
MAQQEEPVRRRVALKVIKLGMDTRQVVARFEAERQALALMDHPNIAKVHDAGTTDTGRPYFIMELVRGIKITEYCDQENLSMHSRLDLFNQVCQAIQHAHQKGITHRDIKPSNILVTVNDGVAIPKVIDFGIAKATADQKLTDKTVFTAFHQFIGTPAYMSPEQTEITSVDVDTRSDIYSLGVLLYELLTGKTPFEAKDLLAAGFETMRKTIREQEPLRPSTRLATLPGDALTTTAKRRSTDPPKLIHMLRGDLDWIVMKCLEKDRTRRYETANGLARDIERHLRNEPVVARPPSAAYRMQKFIQRNKLAVGVGTMLAGVLVLGAAVSLWQAVRATRAEREQKLLRQLAETSGRKALTESAKSGQVSRLLRTMLRSAGPSVAQGRDATMLREILDKAAAGLGQELNGQPEAEAEVRQTLGIVYFDIGDYDKAIAQHREAARLYETVFGERHASVITELGDLANAQRKAEKLTEAEQTARRAVALAEAVYGLDDTNSAMAVTALGVILANQSDQATYAREAADRIETKRVEAERMLRRALEIFRKALGERSSRVAMALQNIAAVSTNAGESEALTLQVVAIRREVFSSVHPQVSFALNNLGRGQMRRGDPVAAEQSFREALAINRQLYGDHHDQIQWSLQNVGEALELQGELPKAEEFFQEGLGYLRKYWPQPSKQLAYHLDRVARVLHHQHKFADAEPFYRELLAVTTQVQAGETSAAQDPAAIFAFPPADHSIIHATTALGHLLADWVWAERDSNPEIPSPKPEVAARAHEAERLLCGVLALREGYSNSTSLALGATRSLVGGAVLAVAIADPTLDSQARAARFTEAENLLLRGDEQIQQSQPAEPKYKRDSAERLVRLYLAWDQAEPGKGYGAKAESWKAKLSASGAEPPR